MVPKFTLVPSALFSEERAGELLSEVVLPNPGEPLSYLSVPEYGSVLIYQGDVPEVFNMLQQLPRLRDYNKLIASVKDGHLYLAVAQGSSLLLCNCYRAVDFTTAEYYIFSALKHFQINPEISTLYFTSPLSQQQMISLCSYFKSAETLL